MDIHICHVYQTIAINDTNTWIGILAANLFIQTADDRHQLRSNLLQIMARPFLQRFSEDRMVRVRADFCHDLNGLRLLNAAGFQETDQFRDNHGRMGIIDLYCSILIQVMQVTAPCNALFQNQLSRVAYHEILLVYAKQSARLVRVIRIQEQGHVLCNLALINRNTIFIYTLY